MTAHLESELRLDAEHAITFAHELSDFTREDYKLAEAFLALEPLIAAAELRLQHGHNEGCYVFRGGKCDCGHGPLQLAVKTARATVEKG